jgi:protein O-mannosyl-transferase
MPPASSEVSLGTHALVALFLGVLVAAAYAPVVNLSFLSDDWAITRLVTVPDARTNWTEILRDFYTPLFFQDQSPFYRPLYVLSFGVDFWLYGTNPTGYHVTNLALHLLCSFFVYLLALELVPGRRGGRVAVTAGAVFALHPLHPEAVTWISGRVDLICAVFYLPALLLFLRWLRSEARAYLALSLVFFALALLAKEMAVTYRGRSLPGAVLGVLPFAVLLGAYLAFRTYVLSGVEAYGVVSRPLDFLASLQGFLYRTGQMFVPVNLELLPSGWRGPLDFLLLAGPMLAAVVVALACYRSWPRGVLPLLLLALYVLSVVPIFKALRPEPDLLSSRWLYLPSVFVAVLIAYGVWTLFSGRWATLVAAVVCVALFAVLALNHGPWLRADELTGEYLRAGLEPDYPVHYKGAPVFVNRITWVSANSPPFTEP